ISKLINHKLFNIAPCVRNVFYVWLYLPKLKYDLLKKLFCLIFLSLPSLIFAQSFGSLNIFSENGDKFYLILDGKKQNDIARSNIRIQELPDLYYSAKIIFEDSSLAPISKNNLYVSDGDDMMKDASYRIRRDKTTTKSKLTFYSMLPVQQNFVATEDMYVFHFGQPTVFETMPVVEKKEIAPFIAGSSIQLGSLNVFSQNGDKFFLFLDGVKQNDIAQSNIRIQQIPGLYYNVKIVFKDTKMAPIFKSNLYISDVDDKLMDAAYRIRRDKAGKPKLNFYSMTKVQENFTAPEGMYVYGFGKADEAIAAVAPAKKTKAPVKGTISNIKVVEQSNATTAATKNKPVASNNTKTPVKKGLVNDPIVAKNNTSTATIDKKKEVRKVIPENKKCNGWPMGKGDLVAAKKTIQETAKEDEKLTAAQEIIASNCLLASQVTEFCALFKSEKSKLAFAKYAYKFTIDRKNYSEVNKALSLETSKKELNKFINGG
ncbi:MAG: DUF4476 domain-containing protein, partial [Ferruginibacter sp.]